MDPASINNNELFLLFHNCQTTQNGTIPVHTSIQVIWQSSTNLSRSNIVNLRWRCCPTVIFPACSEVSVTKVTFSWNNPHIDFVWLLVIFSYFTWLILSLRKETDEMCYQSRSKQMRRFGFRWSAVNKRRTRDFISNSTHPSDAQRSRIDHRALLSSSTHGYKFTSWSSTCESQQDLEQGSDRQRPLDDPYPGLPQLGPVLLGHGRNLLNRRTLVLRQVEDGESWHEDGESAALDDGESENKEWSRIEKTWHSLITQ